MEKKELTLEERLIVPIDVSLEDIELSSDPRVCVSRLRDYVYRIMERYQGTGITLKFNTVLRVLGFWLIADVHDAGVRFFADLKLEDIPATLEKDGEWLNLFQPELLTVMCSATTKGMKALLATLPNTEILGVTVLTSMDEETCLRVFGDFPEAVVSRLAHQARMAKVGGLILSPHEVFLMRERYGDRFTYNCPGIRPEWYQKQQGDDQERVMTPMEAIRDGADRIVMGRPIRNADDPLDAIKRTLEEIQAGLDARG